MNSPKLIILDCLLNLTGQEQKMRWRASNSLYPRPHCAYEFWRKKDLYFIMSGVLCSWLQLPFPHVHTLPLPIVFLHRIGETKGVIVEKYLFFVFDHIPIPCCKLYLQVLAFSNGISHHIFLNCFSNSGNAKDVWLFWKQNRLSAFKGYFQKYFLSH